MFGSGSAANMDKVTAKWRGSAANMRVYAEGDGEEVTDMEVKMRR